VSTSTLGLLLATVPDPTGLGRILRGKNNQIDAIVEEKDATAAERQVCEVYSGICCARARDLKRWLPKLSSENTQKEYYLTEIIQMAVADQIPIVSTMVTDCTEIQGVNNRAQLHRLERVYQMKTATQLMIAGVGLGDAARIDIRGTLRCGMDIFIDVNTVFMGHVELNDGCVIGPNCVLENVSVGANSIILPNSVLENCVIGEDCNIGPFARIRRGTVIADRCKIGNFVETKNSTLGTDSKANHLSYLGDTTIGSHVNIGAGTITCNYDGAKKHQTVIKDGAHIGSDTQLVAPITIGENATIGAGSTIRRDAPANELTLSISTQKTIYGWVRPRKEKTSEKT
jgi:bifunctional UDP-N-acetylglucosamine pyrophosphorylase/glucosamine-1-phosphate N-acetyltransferase